MPSASGWSGSHLRSQCRTRRSTRPPNVWGRPSRRREEVFSQAAPAGISSILRRKVRPFRGSMGAVQDRDGRLDLPVEIQRELRDLESLGAKLTHYQLLGIAADADGGDIRRAYLEKSKRFHPDAWYRKEIGAFAPLLSKWFQNLSAAYQVLSDEELRSAYDREHRSELSQADRAAVERRELSRAEKERRDRESRERLLRTKGFARIGAARKLYEEAMVHAQNG